MAKRTARVCVVTAGHVSTCPRMLKAADALYEAGFDVRVVSTSHTPWAVETDRALHATRRWRWAVVDYTRATARSRQVLTAVRRRMAEAMTRGLGAGRVPETVSVRAYSRAHDELVRAVTAEPADLVYGGTSGALAATAEAAGRLGVPYGLDLEDFHTGESSPPQGGLTVVAERIERRVLPGAAFLTTSSPMMADAYTAKYGLRPTPIHNTFSLDAKAPATPLDGQPLRFYWFSQTLGAGRGLEDFIRASGHARIAGQLDLRAGAGRQYLHTLMGVARDVAPQLRITLHLPGGPDEMVGLARGYDLGLSGEEPLVLNRQLCLGNKIFTYLAAGVPVLMSATPAHAALGRELGDAAIVYEPGDLAALARRLSWLAGDAHVRLQARAAARAAAARRWHWEHPEDRGALVEAVRSALPRPCWSCAS